MDPNFNVLLYDENHQNADPCAPPQKDKKKRNNLVIILP